MRTIAIVIAFGLITSPLHAGSPATKCFDGDSDHLFATDATIAFGMSLDGKMPEIESDSDGKPTKLVWGSRPASTSIKVEEIGRFQEKGIYRVTYHKPSEIPGSSRPQLACVMFGFQDTAPEGMGIRPFFVASDDQIASLESYFTSGMGLPFALAIQKNLQGNGVYWTSYTFEFTHTEARIVERSEGGRRVHTKNYHYNKAGKIIKTETFTNE